MKNPLLLLTWTLLFVACGNEKEPQEQITKLRSLGVEQTPVIAKLGSNVALTFYLAAPKGKVLTAAAFQDSAFRYGTTTAVTLDSATPASEDFGALSVYKLQAHFVVGTSPIIAGAMQSAGSARIRYGVKFTATDGDDESIVGDTLVYPDNATQQSWNAPSIEITKPTAVPLSGTTDLDATITNTNDETTRVAWFVSTGKVKVRRAKTTEWSDAAAGDQTLILTVRGAKSCGFAIKPMKVTRL